MGCCAVGGDGVRLLLPHLFPHGNSCKILDDALTQKRVSQKKRLFQASIAAAYPVHHIASHVHLHCPGSFKGLGPSNPMAGQSSLAFVFQWHPTQATSGAHHEAHLCSTPYEHHAGPTWLLHYGLGGVPSAPRGGTIAPLVALLGFTPLCKYATCVRKLHTQGIGSTCMVYYVLAVHACA